MNRLSLVGKWAIIQNKITDAAAPNSNANARSLSTREERTDASKPRPLIDKAPTRQRFSIYKSGHNNEIIS